MSQNLPRKLQDHTWMSSLHRGWCLVVCIQTVYSKYGEWKHWNTFVINWSQITSLSDWPKPHRICNFLKDVTYRVVVLSSFESLNFVVKVTQKNFNISNENITKLSFHHFFSISTRLTFPQFYYWKYCIFYCIFYDTQILVFLTCQICIEGKRGRNLLVGQQ